MTLSHASQETVLKFCANFKLRPYKEIILTMKRKHERFLVSTMV